MDPMRFTPIAWCLLPAFSLIVSCVAHAPGSEPHVSLRSFLDEDWKYWMTQYPEAATAFGYPGQNSRWTDYSQTAIDARADYLRKSLARLKTIQPAAAERLDYELYRDLLETAVNGLRFHNDAMPIKGVIPHNLLMPMNQLEGIQQDIPHVIAMMSSETQSDYEDIVRRLERVA